MPQKKISVSLPAIVFTDLDGTLLDHHSYSWSAAKETLQQLDALPIPVIFNTSKTRAELEYWQQETNNHHPFIVENGSAVFIPTNYPSSANTQPPYRIIKLGIDRAKILTWLDQLGSELCKHYKPFSALSTEELMALTDLPERQALLALQREYSETFYWHGSDEARKQFIHLARQSGYRVLMGGRFLHVLGQCDKGKASQALLADLQQTNIFPRDKKITAIACGDSDNDIDMLDWADLAIQIRSPVKDFPKISNTAFIQSQHSGPVGWAEAFKQILFTQ